ncbi:MAG: DUF1579 family protein [Saprospiraceae bacterium]|nr:DUF1579 family protein [Saprospiraceae bacterium]
MTRIALMATLLFSFLINTDSIGQAPSDHLAMLTTGVNKNALKTTTDWDKLIGEWEIVLERIGPSGTLINKSAGSWNIFYVLDGLVIQDVFEVTTPSGDVFQFVGLRIFDESTDKWQQVTIDNYDKRLELAEGVSNEETIRLNYSHYSGAELRGTFFNISKDGFIWKQEKLDKQTGTWNMGMRLTAKRKQ